MGLKTFFQPWLIQPTFPSFIGAETEYDPLQDAYDLSIEAGNWLVDAVDQFAYANTLYTDVAEDALAEIKLQRQRRVNALEAIEVNKLTMGAVGVVIQSESEDDPTPVVPEVSDTGGGVVIKDCYLLPSVEADDNPWYVPAHNAVVEPEPVAPKRRPRKAVEQVD